MNVEHVRESDDEDVYKEMVDRWVRESNHIFSIGPKLFDFFDDIYR